MDSRSFNPEVPDKSEIIQCPRGFKTREQIDQNMSNGSPSACNGCGNFTYDGGLGGCKYILTQYF